MSAVGKRIIELLTNIEYYGKETRGVTRLLYKPEWVDAQKYVEKELKQMGIKTNFDEVGNLFGKVEGSKYKDETVATGSHIDTVRNGGIYDGQYGIVAGMLAIQFLVENYGQPLRNLEVISLAEEEGSRFPFVFWGSKNIFGLAKKEDVSKIKDGDGIIFTEAMRKAGFDFRDENKPIRQDIKAFLEIHIEQGAVLEIEKKSVGIVNYIVGQRRFNITIKGQSNHAGTTPMKYRKDTMHAASEIIHRVMEKAIEFGEPLVATVGSITAKPNIVNVVPGETLFTLDTRHTDAEVLAKFTKEIEKIIEDVQQKIKVEIDVDMWMNEKPVPMDTKLVGMLETEAKKENMNYKVMHSGAGHDSQIFAIHVPTAMIFVPSHDGISHNPDEFTEIEDLVKGVELLIKGLYQLAYID